MNRSTDTIDKNETADRKLLRVVGLVLTGLFCVFMAFDIAVKLLQMPIVAQSLEELGWPGEYGLRIGVMELIGLALYLYRRTAFLGAVLMTAIFGGAIASQVRLRMPMFTNELFGVYLGLFMWGGLWMREAALRAQFPLRR